MTNHSSHHDPEPVLDSGGVVIGFEPPGQIVVETPEGRSLFELLTNDRVELHDEVAWSGGSEHGDVKLWNRTTSEWVEAYAQSHGGPR